MTIALRKASRRGHANHGWLDSYHSFSFADYYDPQAMGYRDLRVINEDRIAGGAGFPTHPHRDMEIITYVTAGALAHKDSTGSEGVIRRGDIQAMSAGSGVRHSEFNASASEEARLLQIWIMPARNGIAPVYRQTHIDDADKHNRLRAIVTPDGADGTLAINQDARLYASLLDTGAAVDHALAPGRGVWVQMVAGEVDLNGVALAVGDGAAVEDIATLRLIAKKDSEFLLFDLP